MSQKVLDILEKKFGEAILETSNQHGDETAVVSPEPWRQIAQFLRDDAGCAMDHFIDLTAVDFLDRRTPRFEVVLHLRSSTKLHRIRLKARVDDQADGAPAKIDSLWQQWDGANWFERECYDMFGIRFIGHPDMRRILLYEEFEGHPLRKDYAAAKAQPLVPYRAGATDQLPPFGADQGMPFGRQTHDHRKPGVNLLGFEEEG